MSNSFQKKPIKTNYYRPKPIKTINKKRSAIKIKRQKPLSKKNISPVRKINKRIVSKKINNKRKIKGFSILKLFFSKKVLGCFFIFFLLSAISFMILVSVLSKNIPNPNQLIEREIPQSTVIYDRSGENILYEFHGEEKRTLISLDEIPLHAQQATISIEDKHFYKHKGFSVLAVLRTMVTNVLYNKKAGGSTLTQQFVKNALLSPEKKYSRKIKELIIAQKIEKKFSKNEILQMYLNEIPYGSNAYGIEAASQKYFGKSAKDLVLAESAVLAALPQAPSRYSPYGPNKDLLLGRQSYILNLMEEQGYISKEEKEAAKNYEIKFKGPETNIIAPHFVMYIREILSEKYGEKTLDQGGLKIYTTIDLEKQKLAEEIIKNKEENNAERFKASNASLVAIDPKNGQILAMVGSKDYFNEKIDGQVNVALRPRQPGSSLKPLVYASLFTKGYNPNTILYDVVTNFSASGKDYEPKNYDNKEHGPVSIRKALAGSLNIPAVKAIYLAGVDNVIKIAKDLGYTTLNDPDKYGLSLVLGGGEVKLLEHTNAYSAFAREGEINPISGILKIEDQGGKILEEFQERKKKVLDPNVARMINSILSDNSARSFIFGEKSSLNVEGKIVAVKTGTTNNFRDAWTIGYTPSLVVGVWVGNNDNSEMSLGADGSVVAAPIWNEFMKKSLEGLPNEIFKEPEIKENEKDIINGQLISKKIKINKETNELINEDTPEELIEEIELIDHHSILYYVDKEDPLGAIPQKPEHDPQFRLWEERVINWAKKEDPLYNSDLINKIDDTYNPENIPKLKILSPENNQTIKSDNLLVMLELSAPRGIYKVEYYINNALLEKKTKPPFDLYKNISFLKNGYYNLKIKACDSTLNCQEESLEFNFLLDNNPNNITPNDISINQPGNGLILNPEDFPFSIEAKLSSPQQNSKLKLIIKKSSDEDFSIIKTIETPLEKNIKIDWEDILEAGSYKLYGELYPWGGNSVKSNQITINVN